MVDAAQIAAHFMQQAGWNEDLGSPFTAALLRHMKTDLLGGGPVAELCQGWPGDPRKDALGLRLLGAVHDGVLRGAAPDVARVFPSANTEPNADAVWPIARRWLGDNFDDVRAFLISPPQTNETRRSIALLPGFLQLAHKFKQPLHLLELGASAGLNQNWDRFNYRTDGWQRRGDSDVTITANWRGPPPQHVDTEIEIGSRAACDLRPVNVTDPDEARRLKAYTWPDQPKRLARLDAAIALALETDTRVEAASAGDWLEAKLAARPAQGVTVIYHSVFLIYPPAAEITRIKSLIEMAGRAATPEAPVAWLNYEACSLFGGPQDSMAMETRLQIWPGGETQVLTRSDGHVTEIEGLSPA